MSEQRGHGTVGFVVQRPLAATNNGPSDTSCQVVGVRLAVSISDQVW